VIVVVVAVLALLFLVSTGSHQEPKPIADPAQGALAESSDPPTELACRQVVSLVTDYLDAVLPPSWRAGIDDPLSDCDGCTRYLEQIRATIDALERLDADLHPSTGLANLDPYSALDTDD
jgi:hypothetical protein